MIFNKTKIAASLLCVALLATTFDMTVFAVEIDRTEVRNTIPQIKQMLASCSQKLIE